MKKSIDLLVGFFVILLLVGAAPLVVPQKDVPKKTSKAAINKAREKALEAVVILLKAVHRLRANLDQIESDIFISICNYFEDSEMGCLMVKDITRLEQLEKSVNKLTQELDDQTMNKAVQSVLLSIQDTA